MECFQRDTATIARFRFAQERAKVETETAIPRYKTGDPHPVYNLLAFVEYCDQGHEAWTSVFDDPNAPYRLASKSGEYPPHCRCKSSRNESNATSALLREA